MENGKKNIDTLVCLMFSCLVWISAFYPQLISAQEEPPSEDIEVFSESSLEVDENGIPLGWWITEGDILIPSGGISIKSIYKTDLWTDGIVPYEWDSNLTTDLVKRSKMLQAMDIWENEANIQFIPRGSQLTYLHIRDSSNDPDPRNNSPVGMGFGERIVNITNWDEWICAHELGHTLGYWHEQSRPNRETFVRINEENITDGKGHNFDIHPFDHDYPPGGYDFDSMMHYDQCAFSICPDCSDDPINCCSADPNNCRTITVRAPFDVTWQSEIGQRDHLSRFDAMTMSFLYPEDDWRFVDRNYDGFWENGTLWEPYKTLSKGVEEVPTSGTLWLQPGTYIAGTTLSKPMMIRAPLGSVTLNMN